MQKFKVVFAQTYRAVRETESYACDNVAMGTKIFKFYVKKHTSWKESKYFVLLFQELYKIISVIVLKSSRSCVYPCVYIDRYQSVNIYCIPNLYKTLLCCTVGVPALGELKIQPGESHFSEDS